MIFPIALFSLAISLLIMNASAAPAPDDAKRPTIGLALEGGGALALAHVGIIQWFEQHHIPIDYLAGTSMGGLVGGFYASGMSAEEMRHKVDGLDWNALVNGQVDYRGLAFRPKQDDRELGNASVVGLRHGLVLPSGLSSGQALDLLLSEIALPYGNTRSFDDLPTPFRTVATDLVTAKATVFNRGDLSEALRATSSIPGLFEPVLKKQKGAGTQEYVDGGLLNNLPVDLVKAMGADIVIAVFLADDPYNPNKPHNALDILSRSVSAVMAANERHNIEMADILVSVRLPGLSVSDYSKAQQIMDLGIEGAEQRKTVLSKFALSDSDWMSYLQKRESRRKTALPAPQFVAIEGLEGSAAKKNKLAGELQTYFVDQIGKPLDPARVEAQIGKIMGMGVFAHISYAEIERDGKPGLAIEVEQSDSRPPTLQPALTNNGADYLNPQITFSARITAADLGGFRSELRTQFLFGSAYGISAEYFHPFAPLSRWFIAPHGSAENQPLDFYHRSRILAFDREHTSGGGLDVGYSISNTGEVRLGYEAAEVSTTLRVGDALAFPILQGAYRAAHLSYVLDRVDDEIVPHSGVLARINLRRVDANPGADRALPVLDLSSTFFQPVGPRGTLFAGAEGGTIFGAHNAGLPFFFLGGPQRLSAYGMNELTGNQYFLGRAGFLRQVSASIPFADGRIYLFADYEVAKMYGAPVSTAIPMDANAGVLVRTLLGPLFIGGSTGDAGHRKWYFQLGRFF